MQDLQSPLTAPNHDTSLRAWGHTGGWELLSDKDPGTGGKVSVISGRLKHAYLMHIVFFTCQFLEYNNMTSIQIPQEFIF